MLSVECSEIPNFLPFFHSFIYVIGTSDQYQSIALHSWTLA